MGFGFFIIEVAVAAVWLFRKKIKELEKAPQTLRAIMRKRQSITTDYPSRFWAAHNIHVIVSIEV